MKIYDIYVLEDDKYNKIKSVYDLKDVRSIARKHNIIKVNCFTSYSGCEEKFKYSKIFVSGEEIYKQQTDITFEDTIRLTDSFACLYLTNGEKLYMSNSYYSVERLKVILGIPEKEWFTIKITEKEVEQISTHEKKSLRIAIITYDWDQHKCTLSKVYNKTASEELGFELYGTILTIDENFII